MKPRERSSQRFGIDLTARIATTTAGRQAHAAGPTARRGHRVMSAAAALVATAVVASLTLAATTTVRAAEPQPPTVAGSAASAEPPASSKSSAQAVATSPSQTPPQAAAQVPLIDQAVSAYQSAQELTDRDQRLAAFARAELLFRTAAQQSRPDADLWANVGTAALQAEHLGPAIAAYRRALQLDPDHRRASQNIEHARTLLPPWVPRPESEGLLDSFFEWHRAMAAAERSGAASIAFALACALLGAGIARRSTMLRLFSMMPAVACGLLLASLLLGDGNQGGDAVVVGDDTVARAADSRNAPTRFTEPLPSGTEVRVAEHRGAWTRIVLADERDAWIPGSSLEQIGR